MMADHSVSTVRDRLRKQDVSFAVVNIHCAAGGNASGLGGNHSEPGGNR